jgi:hypothetical protein
MIAVVYGMSDMADGARHIVFGNRAVKLDGGLE